MINKVLCGGAVLALLSACSSTTTGGGPTTLSYTQGDATASSGYSDGSQATFDTGIVLTNSAAVISVDSTGAAALVNKAMSLEVVTPVCPTCGYSGGPVTITFNYDGKSLDLTDADGPTGGFTYTGVSTDFPDGIAVSFVAAPNGNNVGIFRIEIDDDGVGNIPSGAGRLAYVPLGINSSPTSINALTGTATYIGTANISVIHETGGVNAGRANASGVTNLTANFDADTISGNLNGFTDDGSGGSYVISGSTDIAISGTISGNTFNGTATATNWADLQMSGATGSMSGMFYGPTGADHDMAGTINATGTSTVGSGSALLIGGFSGQE